MKIALLLQSMDITLFFDKEFSINLTDNVKLAVSQMTKWSVSALPVLDKHRFVGCVSLSQLQDKEESIRLDQLVDSINSLAFVDVHTHWYDVIKEMKRHQLACLAVLDKDKYRGVITPKSLFEAMANNSSIMMPGTIIVLEINTYDYMLSRIAQITEEKNVKIMCLNVESREDTPFIRLHLKLNTNEIESISRDLERYGFQIIETYQENSAYQEDIMDNYDALMKYLSV